MLSNNKWRRRIIRLLEELLGDLQSRPPSAEQAAVIGKHTKNRADSMFEGLERVEVAESLYYANPIEVPKTEDPNIYRLQQCAEDTAFAVYCFLQDATYFRLFSARAWRDFINGKISIQTATFCTNIADGHIGTMSIELRTTFRAFEDTLISRMHGNVDGFLRRHCGDDALVLGSPLDAIGPDCADLSLARHARRRLGYYVSTMSCQRTTRILFMNFVVSGTPHIDEHTHLVKSIYQLRCLEWPQSHLSTVFQSDCMFRVAHHIVGGSLDSHDVLVAQMLCDIQLQLDPQHTAIEDIAESLGQDYFNLYHLYRELWCNGQLAETCPERYQRMLTQFGLLKDALEFETSLQETVEGMERPINEHYTTTDFQLLRHAPSLVGCVVAQYHFRFQYDFLDLSNDYGHILTAIHFYNAAKSSGSLHRQQWEDIEWVIDRQSHHNIYAGAPPSTGPEFVSCFCQVYGLDAAKFASDLQLPVVGKVKKNIRLANVAPRRLESCSGYVRGCVDDQRNPLTRIKMAEKFADEQLDFSSPYGKPSTIGVLIAAKESHDSDEEALHFNIFDLHVQCYNLISDIRDMCLREAPNDYPAVRFGGKADINPVIAELLRDLADVPRHHEGMWPKAVKMLSDFIDRLGSRCYEAALQRMEMTTWNSIDLDALTDDSRSPTVRGVSPVDTFSTQSKAGRPGGQSISSLQTADSTPTPQASSKRSEPSTSTSTPEIPQQQSE